MSASRQSASRCSPGSVINVPAGTPLQSANHGSEELIVYAYGYPPDEGAEVLEPAV